ncbi:MAG: YccF domain-containing protein [Candidatus Cryptobacteroides sp.]
MNTLGNILWFLLGGFLIALYYAVFGLLMCLTIIGIPFGVQLFKMAGLALCPFGRDVRLMKDSGCLTVAFNLLWILTGWWELAVLHIVLALLCAITIIGIPFAKAHWRLLKMSILPFGSGRG